MGAIQQSINQALSVGAILASQSDYLKEQSAAARARKELAAQEETYQQSQKLRSAEKGQLTKLQKKTTAQEEKLKGALASEKLKEAYPELNIDTEKIRGELSEKFKADVEKTAEKEALASEHEINIAQQGVDISKKRYELEPTRANLQALTKSQDVLSSAKRAQSSAAKKQSANLSRLEELEYYKQRATAALQARRQELGDVFLGGEKIQDPALIARVQAQLQKEDKNA